MTQPSGFKHETVRAYLAELVGELGVGDPIPSERVLCERFGVSRMTVRQAVDALVAEGALRREQGRGTFVAPRRIDFEMRLTTFGEEMRSRGLEPDSRVLFAGRVPATVPIAEALQIAPGDLLHHLERVRTADGLPMSVERLWVPVALVPGLLDGGTPDSVYAALRGAGCAPSWGEDTLTASEATEHESRLLGLPVGNRVVMRAERRTYADIGPCMYSTASYRGDRYSVWVPLRAPGEVLTPRQRNDEQVSA
ncbi:GntR family transcriptional regulator [Cellulomonas sp. RIT-PI-Y]|jgi:GntR family transcriptional regulator|uniref:GntR family transcriptional regulator n=1 Tax=Cellulomonas sp. RIT-PI-Y TaxID=3035297 RepID=UPI0021DA7D71|nr:GntR family transcriptional regulator [Cellulomonas sp. RIT-PI-Y]